MAKKAQQAFDSTKLRFSGNIKPGITHRFNVENLASFGFYDTETFTVLKDKGSFAFYKKNRTVPKKKRSTYKPQLIIAVPKNSHA